MTEMSERLPQMKGQTMAREELLAETFVQLADSLVDEFDIIDLLTVVADRCVELLDTDAAGILLADSDGNLRVMAASNEQARMLELFQLQNDEGPCLDAYSTGQPVVCTDLRLFSDAWPVFASEALDSGFLSVYAFPLRLRNNTLGALNLFRTNSRQMPETDIRLAQALGDSATIAILQDQAIRDVSLEAGRLQHALDSRITIEQAKGMLAERSNIDMSDAFERMRTYSRANNRQLTAVAADIIAGTLPLDALIPQPA